MPTFDSHGVQLHYETFGEGRPLLLVHGFASSLDDNWMRTGWVKRLSSVRRVIGLDCRGHGESEKPRDPAAYAGDAMPMDVIRLMDHASIDRADLFGYSMGAGISLRLLLSHPDRFSSVILGGIGDGFLERGGARPAVAQALLAEDPATIADPVGKGFRVFAEAGGNDLRALAAYHQAPRTPIDVSQLGDVSAPVLIVVGEDDALVGKPDRLQAAIPGARVQVIPDTEHLTVVPDRRFKEAVLAFLADGAAA